MALQFKAKYPFLEVNINRAEGERIVTRVLQEARAKNPCGCHSNAGILSARAEKKGGKSGKYPPQTTASTRAISKKRKFGPRLITIPMSFFTTRSSSLPKTFPSIDDLLGPFWKNKMILEKDKIDWFTAMLHILGREKGIDG